MPAAKRPGVEAVEAYLARVPEPHRSALEKLREMIRKTAPKDAEETISYQLPAFYYQGPLVAYGAFKEHCSFFPMAAGMADLLPELAKYDTSKGTIRFAPEKPLPAALVKKVVKARVEWNEQKRKKK
jgi:uncharacterized protein YdhG (YjbR/CyaY superfamily)